VLLTIIFTRHLEHGVSDRIWVEREAADIGMERRYVWSKLGIWVASLPADHFWGGFFYLFIKDLDALYHGIDVKTRHQVRMILLWSSLYRSSPSCDVISSRPQSAYQSERFPHYAPTTSYL